jgi:hypothetical protein
MVGGKSARKSMDANGGRAVCKVRRLVLSWSTQVARGGLAFLRFCDEAWREDERDKGNRKNQSNRCSDAQAECGRDGRNESVDCDGEGDEAIATLGGVEG